MPPQNLDSGDEETKTGDYTRDEQKRMKEMAKIRQNELELA